MTAACPACAAAPLAVELAQSATTVQLSVPEIRCATCINTIEKHLAQQEGVRDARVNLSLKRVSVATELPAQVLTEALAAVGYKAYPLDAKALGQGTDRAGRDLILRMGVAGFAMMNVMLLSVAVWSGATGATRDLFHLISAAIALPAVIYSAQPFFRNALNALKARRLNMDVPISLAIVLAAAMSLYETLNSGEHAYFDAALSLTFFLLIGRYLEHHTRSSARSAAKELAALEVHTAERKIGAQVETVAVDALAVGDRVLVPTGVRVPVDGRLDSAEAFTDRSFLTGESDPVTHMNGAGLNAGEINLGAPFEMIVEAVGRDTRLHQIATLVETAENARNRYTSLADRAAQIYAPAVHVLALATFLGWMVVDGDVRHALNVAIAVLIITCPCALGLAVPAVSTAAISRLYRLGFLVKSGTALERLAEVKTLVLDKTGTLTRPGFDFDLSGLDSEKQRIAKALAQTSAHPLSKALNRALTDIEPMLIENIEEIPGKGVTGQLGNMSVALGSGAWLGEGLHGLAVKVGQEVFALPHSEALIDGVDSLSKTGLKAEIISGDTQQKTAQLAAATGIHTFHGNLTPEDKNAHIGALSDAGETPCMVGDGLNDTVALASAHASIAPGSALDAARNAADVVLIGDSLKPVPQLFNVARKAVRLSRQNFGIAVAYNAIAIPIAILGYATPLAAALAMSLSSITVLLNAVRVGRGA